MLVISMLFGITKVRSQITTNPNAILTTMIQGLMGPGNTVSNVTRTCPTGASGTFANGSTTNLNINSGVVLTTGSVNQISGTSSQTASSSNGGGSYSLHDPIANATTTNACVIEFDVVPSCSTLSIRYVFSSEEYPEFVNSAFNDAFAFFVSGPNPLSGNYVNKNIALVPSTSTPITINTINNGGGTLQSQTDCTNGIGPTGPCTNCSYYIVMLAVTLNAQQDSALKKNRKWLVGISFSPDYSYRKLVPIEHSEFSQMANQINKNTVDSLNLMEKGKIAFTFGASLSYKFNKHISLNTGFYYSDKGIQSKGFLTANLVYMGDYLFQQDSYKKSKFYFYELPIALSYSINLDSAEKHSVSFFIGTTFSLNSKKYDYISRRVITQGTPDTNIESSYIPIYAEANSIFRIGYTVSVGYNMKISERLSLSIEPVFKYYPYEFYSRSMINWHNRYTWPITALWLKEKPYSFGCNFGLKYNF